MSKIIELAKKLKALAEQGVGGEKVNAKKMLNALCVKHNIDPAQLDEEKRERHWFAATKATDQLMNQVIWQVCGNSQKIYPARSKKYGAFSTVTEAQRLEILARHQIYARALKTAFEDLEIAFIVKNRIFGEDDDNEPAEPKPRTPEQRAADRRRALLAEGLTATPVHKQLAAKK